MPSCAFISKKAGSFTADLFLSGKYERIGEATCRDAKIFFYFTVVFKAEDLSSTIVES